ncbi:MAG: response regulator transcription factor [Bacteroidota bacterium]
MIRVAIADDETLFREGLKQLIEGFERITVTMEAYDGANLIDQLAATEALPHILLLDLNMPAMTGIEATKVLREQYPDVKVIVLSTHFNKAFILNMVELGASSYLPKNCKPDELENTIHKVFEKGFYYSTEVMMVIRENMMRKSKPKARFLPELTRRELEVLQLICEQYSSTEIAEKLFISPRTVDGHRNNLLEKLSCRNTAGLVVYAIHHKLVEVVPDTFWNRKS